MRIFNIVLSYEYYIYEFVILNDFYKIIRYIDYNKYDNTLYIHHLRDNI